MAAPATSVTAPMLMVLEARATCHAVLSPAYRHVVILDHVGRPQQDEDPKCHGPVRKVGSAENMQRVRRTDLHHQNDRPNQGKHPKTKSNPREYTTITSLPPLRPDARLDPDPNRRIHSCDHRTSRRQGYSWPS